MSKTKKTSKLRLEHSAVISDRLHKGKATGIEVAEKLRQRFGKNRRATMADSTYEGLSHLPKARDAQLQAEHEDREEFLAIFHEWLDQWPEQRPDGPRGRVVGYGEHIHLAADGHYSMDGQLPPTRI